PLGPRVMNALRADPKSVDVRAQAQWFYGIGERVLELFEEEGAVEVLSDTFQKRAMEIADKAQNTRTVQQGAGSGDFLGTLDETERSRNRLANECAVFRAAHDGTNAVKKWLDHTSKT
ncbi:hypothetical protein BDY17DRAFT_258930, partial [Neohortaea acidophila]